MAGMKNTRASRCAGLSVSGLLIFTLAGCLGWGAMFAPKHAISGDYALMQGEGGDDIYLMVKDSRSASLAPSIKSDGTDSTLSSQMPTGLIPGT